MNSGKLLSLMMVITLLMGCASSATHYNSSAVAYLYPERDRPVEPVDIPRLTLPIQVGIAFVPDNPSVSEKRSGGLTGGWDAQGRGAALTESEKNALLAKVSRRFEALEFVQSIDIIPSAYLVPRGSFANLDQIRTMFGVDVIALIAYDQTQFTDEGVAAITYWTLVGAYLVPGEKNATHTMVDASVFDIASRKLLFRAPGVSYLKSTATPVNLSEQLRRDRASAFDLAADDLLVNLERQLEQFRVSIRKRPESVTIDHRPGYAGGGSMDGWMAMMFVVAGAAGFLRRIRRPS